MRLSESQRAFCLEASTGIARNLIERAKAHRAELYWDLGAFAKSNEDRRVLETSLGFGSPGILLFLAEYFRHTRDAEVLPCIDAAMTRLHRLLARGEEASHGFYTGILGSSYALREVERLTGISCGPDGICGLVGRALEALTARKSGASSGLSNGVAGSMLGLDLLADLDAGDLATSCRGDFVRLLLRQFHVAPAGVSCGRHFDAIQSPVGFFSGNAGVRHVLNRYGEQSAGWRAVVAEMDRYEDAAFDGRQGNWRDYINEEFFNGAEHANRLNRDVAHGRTAAFERHGDSIWWGTGTAGIMLAHLPASAPGAIVSSADARVIDIGLRKICSSLSRFQPAEARYTLYDGWSGVALSLAHCLEYGPRADMEAAVQTIIEGAHAQYGRRGRLLTGAWNEASRLGLLLGEAGIGCFLLKLLDGVGGHSILRPLAPADAVPDAASWGREEAGRVFLTNTFPLTSRVVGAATFPVPLAISQESCIEAVQTAVKQVGSTLAGEVFDFECSRQTLERDAGSNLFLASREAYRRQAFSATLEHVDDATILGGRFQRVPEMRLGVLPFLLSADEEAPPSEGGSTPVLLQARSDGVETFVLTREAYYVLTRLNKISSPQALVATGLKQWPLVEHSREEATALVVANIRAGLACGYLVRKGDA